jgi:hypothetical protein
MTTKKRNIRQPQQLPMSKIEGYFMITKADALLAVSQKLTGSQLRLWIYLMATDSFADYTSGGEVKYHDLPPLADIAVAIGGSLDRVEKDLRKLRKLGLYDYRTVTVQGHNLTAAKAKVEAQRLAKVKSQSSPRSNQVKRSAYLDPNGDYLDPNGDYLDLNGDYLDPNGDYLDREQSPKSLPDKPDSAPQTIQTYTDFIQTLSEGERENFWEFGLTKAKQLPRPPELSLKWIEAHWQELRSQWEKTEAGQTAKNSQTDWTQHPNWSEWLDFIRSRGVPTFVALGEWLDRKTRREIADWADERNLIWGISS